MSNSTPAQIVTLTRDSEDIPNHTLDRSRTMHVQVRGPDGGLSLISRKYLNRLQADGWRGLDQIPPECVK